MASAPIVPHMALTLAAMKDDGVMEKFWIQRRGVGEDDVRVEIEFCGICHSDLHQIKGDWGSRLFPMVPGHEMVGRVSEVGKNVSRFSVGDRVGVGCFVDSCGDCTACEKGEEPYCPDVVSSYNSRRADGTREFGGYSQSIVTRDHFVVHVPDSMDMAEAAPLLCAGITTYSPLVHFGARDAGASFNVAVIGFGGLGHMAVKIALAMGNNVTVLSRSARKAATVRALGAKFVNTRDRDQAAAVKETFDLILDTASANHDIEPYMKMLRCDGKLVVLGLPTKPFSVRPVVVIGRRRSLAGSLVGGMRETQEMLNFCAEHNISADVQLIDAADVHQALRALQENSSPASRFVIKVKETLKPGDWSVRAPPAGYVEDESGGEAESKTGCGCGKPGCTCPAGCCSTGCKTGCCSSKTCASDSSTGCGCGKPGCTCPPGSCSTGCKTGCCSTGCATGCCSSKASCSGDSSTGCGCGKPGCTCLPGSCSTGCKTGCCSTGCCSSKTKCVAGIVVALVATGALCFIAGRRSRA